MAEARERDGRARAAEIRNDTVDAERGEENARDDVSRQDARGGERGFIDQDLSDEAQSASD